MGRRRWLAVVAMIAICLPNRPLAAAEQAPFSAPTIAPVIDLRLDAAGRLHGELRDGAGSPLAGVEIVAWQDGREAARQRTDSDGRFVLAGLHGGLCHLSLPQGDHVVRVWTAAAAPPAARERLLLIAGPLARGQLGEINPLAQVISAPGFAIAVLAAAVAVPIAIGAANKDKKSGS